VKAFLAAAALLLVAGAAAAQDRAIPFWPDAVPAAIHAEIDGGNALETVRELARFHRVQGSPGYFAAAEFLRSRLAAAGLADASIERFPADGKTRYAHFRSYYGWTPVRARLEEISPRARLVTSFPELPVALADYSQDADVSAELVDVGRGTDPKDYAGKTVAGRIVLADGPLPAVHERACEERKAAGFLSAFPNQTTAWSGDDRDLVRWGHLSPYRLDNRFAFMVSKRQAEDFRARLSAGERIVLRAKVAARMTPATFDVVSATIPGSDRAAGEIVLTAHFCHESAGANDNASGSAALFEIAKALRGAMERGLGAPRRTIRFLWLPEIAGSQAWLIRHPEIARRLVAGIHLDMVGGLLSTTRGTLHVSRSAESLPHAVNDVAEAFLEEVLSASARHAERGGNPERGFVWPPGSREALLADLRGVELGSDHQVFEDSSFAVPMVYFHDWPDVTIHTNKDLPENLDATKLGRVAYMAAGIAWTLAALPDAQAPRLLALVAANSEARIARAGFAPDRSPRDAALQRREAVEQAAAAVRSVGELWPSVAHVAHEAERGIRGLSPEVSPETGGDFRVPTRNSAIVGPLDVYYSDYLTDAVGADAAAKAALPARRDGVLAWEAFNLVDGKRTVAAIRDVLTGRYDPVPLGEVSEYFDLLARAKAVTFR
jgi:aminopeptidase YwaD